MLRSAFLNSSFLKLMYPGHATRCPDCGQRFVDAVDHGALCDAGFDGDLSASRDEVGAGMSAFPVPAARIFAK